MLTMIIAIYGAVTATASIIFTAWSFWASGPRLQVEARLLPRMLMPDESDDGRRTFSIRASNTGRLPIKFDILNVDIRIQTSFIGDVSYADKIRWHGPALPASIPAQSGEEWNTTLGHLGSQGTASLESTKIVVRTMTGGHKIRTIEMPASNWREIIENPKKLGLF
jgi:hypothetical protein